jgi:hypothetical protein
VNVGLLPPWIDDATKTTAHEDHVYSVLTVYRVKIAKKKRKTRDDSYHHDKLSGKKCTYLFQ